MRRLSVVIDALAEPLSLAPAQGAVGLAMALTRRALLASFGVGGIAAAAGGGYALGREDESDAGGPTRASRSSPFHGRHQAGIATPAQDRLHFAALDVEDGVRASDLRDLLRAWSRAARSG